MKGKRDATGLKVVTSPVPRPRRRSLLKPIDRRIATITSQFADDISNKLVVDGYNVDVKITPNYFEFGISSQDTFEKRRLIIVNPRALDYLNITMEDMTAYFAVARRAFNLGLSVAELDKAIDDKVAAKVAARETTERTKDEPRPDWIEARERGISLPDFIKDKFATEIATGTMTRAMLYRYDKLASDFYGYPRHHEMPKWLDAIPAGRRGRKRLPVPATKPVRSDEVRRYLREQRRFERANKPNDS